MNPLICIRGSASPGHSYPMTPLYVRQTGEAPRECQPGPQIGRTCCACGPFGPWVTVYSTRWLSWRLR